MAYISHFTCKICQEPRQEVVGNKYPYICASCRAAQAAIEKKAFMDKLKLMPLEKRVERIEEYLYDSDIVDRLKFLEHFHRTY